MGTFNAVTMEGNDCTISIPQKKMPHKTPPKPKSKAERARQYLHAGGILREDSDDELGLEDHPWEWIYASETDEDDKEPEQIVGARMGEFQCAIGDYCLLKAEGTNEAWVGIICGFEEDEDHGEKAANFMWFSTDKEIRNKQKKRTDALPVGLTACSLESQLLTNRLPERSLYNTILGREPPVIYQRESHDRLSGHFQTPVPVR